MNLDLNFIALTSGIGTRKSTGAFARFILMRFIK
jgi:hypothetical protein